MDSAGWGLFYVSYSVNIENRRSVSDPLWVFFCFVFLCVCFFVCLFFVFVFLESSSISQVGVCFICHIL